MVQVRVAVTLPVNARPVEFPCSTGESVTDTLIQKKLVAVEAATDRGLLESVPAAAALIGGALLLFLLLQFVS